MAKKVLIIDDNPDDVKNAAGAFKSRGIISVCAKCDFDILSVIYSEVPDLIILDILMPEPGGYELCRIIKSDELTGCIPVIMYSALDKNIDKFWAYRSGANGFINKKHSLEELVSESEKIINQMPVSLEQKARLLGSKAISLKTNTQSCNSKEELVKDFNSIKELDGDLNILAIKIFRVIYRYFKYSLAMICFKQNSENTRLLFDCSDCETGRDVFEEIKNKINLKEAHCEILLKKEAQYKAAKIDDFSVRYEYEINSDTDTIGWLYLYSRDNLSSQELKLSGTIKDLLEHIMRLRYFKMYSKAKPGANPRKLYTQLDFDRILSYEYGWHKRNSAPLCLAFMEIESLENMEKQYGAQYCDILVAKISNLLSGALSDGDFIYRNEDDIFAILMTNSNKDRVLKTLDYILSKIEDPALNNLDKDDEIKVKIGALMLDDSHKNHYEYIDAIYDVLDEARHGGSAIVVR